MTTDNFTWLLPSTLDYFDPHAAPLVLATIAALDDETATATLKLAATTAAWAAREELN